MKFTTLIGGLALAGVCHSVPTRRTFPPLQESKRQLQQPGPAENVYTFALDTEPHWYPNNFTLYTKELVQNHFQSTPYVANGYIGQRFAAEGHGYQEDVNVTYPTSDLQPLNGWPLDDRRFTFGTVSGFWDSQPNTSRTNFADIAAEGGESVISGLPSWVVLHLLTAKGETYGPGTDNSTVSNYYQSMSLLYGIVSTTLTWKPKKDEITYTLNYTSFANRFRPNVGYVQLDITADQDTEVSIVDILDGRGAARTWPIETGMEPVENTIWSGVHPYGLPNTSAYVYSTLNFSEPSATSARMSASSVSFVSQNVSTASQQLTVQLKAGTMFTVYKHVGIASTDAFPNNTKEVARTASLAARNAGVGQLLLEHRGAWDLIWEEGMILTPDDEELQISIHASIFHLLSSLRSGYDAPGMNDNSISVGGLTSDSYAGFVFWDADLWMEKGLSTLWPQYALPMINYRNRQLNQSTVNAVEHGYGSDTAALSWTSGRYGNCTGTGPCFDYQYHLNGDVVLSVYEQFQQTNDMTFLNETGWPIVRKITNFFTEYVKLANGTYHTFNLTDPDEYANHVNDTAYTNYLIVGVIDRALELAKFVDYTPPSNWTEIRDKMYLPYDYKAGIIPEYQGMNGSVDIKQVDVGLIYFPLQEYLNNTQVENDLFYYSKYQSPDGPAMTWGIYSIISASVLESGCSSWTHAVQGSQTYLRAPWYQFSEQVNDDYYTNGGTNPAFPFLTGHGGYLQVWTHGYTGFRSRSDAFYLDPSLPPQISGGVEYKSFKWQGASFNINITQTNTIITRVVSKDSYEEYKGAVPVMIGGKRSDAGNHTLNLGDSLTVITRLPHKNAPYTPGNIAQCVPVTSNVTWSPANFPIAAVDGSNATTWQPRTTDPSSIVVDLSSMFPPASSSDTTANTKSFNQVILTWGESPPVSWHLEAANMTDGPWESVWSQEQVKISVPYNATKYIVPVIENGNSTTQLFDRTYEGRYVRLTIAGNQGVPSALGFGATVAEMALIGQ